MREIAHFVRHAPAALALKRGSSTVELYEALFDRADEAGFAEQRRELVHDLVGDVLEVGCGTGRTLKHYAPGVRLTAIDTDETFLSVARERAQRATCHVRVSEASATSLPFEDASFDVVVFSLVLCSVDDVARTLAEARRVLRPRGRLRALEHVRSDERVAGVLMRLVDPFWVVANGMGCHMGRATEVAIARAEFTIESAARSQIFAPGLPAFPLRQIRATPRAASSPRA